MGTQDKIKMTNRELWLKLFSENNVALATAIHLCKRYVTDQQLQADKDFILAKVSELQEEVPEEQIDFIFGETK